MSYIDLEAIVPEWFTLHDVHITSSSIAPFDPERQAVSVSGVITESRCEFEESVELSAGITFSDAVSIIMYRLKQFHRRHTEREASVILQATKPVARKPRRRTRKPSC